MSQDPLGINAIIQALAKGMSVPDVQQMVRQAPPAMPPPPPPKEEVKKVGYYSYISGELEFDVELPQKVLDDGGWGEDGGSDFAIHFIPGEETVGLLPDGTIGVIGNPGHSVVKYRYEEPTKTYDVEDQVLAIVKAVRKKGGAIKGILNVQGEEPRDIWRVRVEHDAATNKVNVISEKPKLVWPNGDEEPCG